MLKNKIYMAQAGFAVYFFSTALGLQIISPDTIRTIGPPNVESRVSRPRPEGPFFNSYWLGTAL